MKSSLDQVNAVTQIVTTNTSRKIQRIAFTLVGLALAVGFFSRVFSVFRYTTFDVGFAPDQVRDAEVYMGMWQGIFPSLGPASSIGNYNLPPLYYYLVFPFTIFGPEPALQALPNAILSFLSIPLLICLIYQLLEHVEFSKRLFWASFAGFWYSLLFTDIYLSTFHWNPSPIPFFLFSFILLLKDQLETQRSAIFQFFSWTLYGIILAILTSLHSSTLFIMPIVFVGSSILFIVRNYKSPQKCLFPFWSGSITLITLLPYWNGEVSRNWMNTKEILLTVVNSGGDASNHSLLNRLSSVLFTYLELGRQVYFIGSSWLHTAVTTFFLLVVLVLGVRRFRGNKIIFTSLCFIWILYLYAASNHLEPYPIHFKMLILAAPIIFTILSFVYLDASKQTLLNKILRFSLVLFIGLSMISNSVFDHRYFLSKHGFNRVVSTDDIAQLINRIPENSTICDPKVRGWREVYNDYKYIGAHVLKKDLNTIGTCQSGNYVIHSKFRYEFLKNNLWPAFELVKNEDFNRDADLWFRNSVVDIYLLKKQS